MLQLEGGGEVEDREFSWGNSVSTKHLFQSLANICYRGIEHYGPTETSRGGESGANPVVF